MMIYVEQMVQPWWHQLVGPVGGAAVVSAAGVWAYFNQKQCETNRRVYLDNGLELLANQYEATLGTFRTNWSRSLFILRQLRDMGGLVNPEVCNGPFIRLDPSTFQTGTHQRVFRLVHDKVFWDAQQKLLPFVENASDFLAWDLCGVVHAFAQGVELTQSPQEIYEQYLKDVQRMEIESRKFYVFRESLEDLVGLLQKQSFTTRSIARFHSRTDVRKLVEKARSAYEEHLAEEESAPN